METSPKAIWPLAKGLGIERLLKVISSERAGPTVCSAPRVTKYCALYTLGTQYDRGSAPELPKNLRCGQAGAARPGGDLRTNCRARRIGRARAAGRLRVARAPRRERHPMASRHQCPRRDQPPQRRRLARAPAAAAGGGRGGV